VDYVATWGDFLKAWSLLDDHQYSQLAPLLLETQAAPSHRCPVLIITMHHLPPLITRALISMDSGRIIVRS